MVDEHHGWAGRYGRLLRRMAGHVNAGGLSIGARLMLLLATVFLPAIAGFAWFIFHEHGQARDAAYAQVRLVAHSLTSDIRSILTGSEETLEALAARPAVRALDPGRCDPVFQEHSLMRRESTALELRDAQGRLICSSLSNSTPFRTSQVLALAWFREAIANNRFSVSPVTRGVSSGRWVTNPSYPVRDDAGRVTGLLIIGIDLLKLQERLARFAMPGAQLATFDREYNFLLRSIEPEKWIGQPLPATQLAYMRRLQDQNEAYLSAPNIAGAPRLWCLLRMPDVGWSITVGLPEDAVLGEARANLRYSVAAGVGVLPLMMAMAWFVSSPIRRIESVSRRVIDGDHSAAEAFEGPVELRAVAAHFNRLLDERERTLEALSESREVFRKAFHAYPDSMTLVRLEDGALIEVNDRFESFTGSSRAEALGRTGRDLGLWTDPAQRDFMFAELRAGRSLSGLEALIRRKDGDYRVGMRYSTLIGIGGVPHILSVMRDVTGQKKTEEALRLSEEKFSKAFHASPHWIGITRLDTGEFIEVNQGFEKISGYSRAEALGRTSLDLGLWARPGQREELIAGLAAGRWMHDVEVDVRRKDGAERTCLFSHETIDLAGVRCLLAIGRDETEIRLARQVLERERDLAANLADTMPAIVLVLDPDGCIRDVNPFFEHLTGWRLDDVRGREWFDTFLPLRDHDRMRAHFQVATHDVPTRGNINAILTRSGEECQIDWNDHALRDAAGRVTGLLAVGIDVTERQQAAEALRSSEARFRAVIDASPVPMALNDGAQRITYLNPVFTRTFGYDLDDIPTLADWWPKAYPDPAYRQRVAESWQDELIRAAQTGTAVRPMEVKVHCKDGTERTVEASAAPLYGGLSDTSVVVIHHITQLKNAQAAISESVARLNEAQRIAKVGSWDLDLISGTLNWSDENFRLFEIDAAKFGATYEAFLDAIHPEDRAAVNAAYTGSLRTREPYSIGHRLRMSDGRIKFVEEQCETDFALDGTPLRSRGTVQDVTERVLAGEAIQRSLREKETLLREIHHRVKNNLRIISSLLHFQSRKVKDAGDVAAFEEGRERLKSMILVHETLCQSQNLSRIEFGDYARKLVEQVSASYRANLKEVQVRVDAAAAVYLPIEVALPLGMLLSELLTNAFKYAYADGRQGTLRVTVGGVEGRLELAVADDGPGLPAGVDPEAPAGFGMQLVANLAEQLGGEVRYERGAGLRVVVAVPLEAREQNDEERSA